MGTHILSPSEGADAVGFRSRGITLSSRPLTPLTARNFQRAAADSSEPSRQWSRRATRFPFPLPPRTIGEQKAKVKSISGPPFFRLLAGLFSTLGKK